MRRFGWPVFGGEWGDGVTVPSATYQRAVVIGASIMNGLAGNNLTTPHAGATTALGMDVYGGSTAGETLSEQIDNVQAAIAAFPAVGETVFLLHSGGNDVSAHMPFDAASPATLDTMRANLNALLDAFGAHLPHVVAMPPSFRSYTGLGYGARELFNDQMRGALGFNEAVFKPIYQARIAPRWRYADGESVMCFYDLVRNNFEGWLTDGIHIGWTADRRATLLGRLGQALAGTTPVRITPDPVDPAAPFVQTPPAISPATGSVGTVFTLTYATFGGTPQPTPTHTLTQAGSDVTAQISGGQFTSTAEGALVWTATATTTSGTATEVANATVTAASSTQDMTFINFVSAAAGTAGLNEYVISQANGVAVGTSIDLLTFDGVDTGWNYHPESVDGVAVTSQIGANLATIDGGTAFDGSTIYSLEVFDATLYTTHPNNLVHVFDGLTPGASYQLHFVGSRSGTTARTSRFLVEGGGFVDAVSNANPPTATAIVDAVADGSGLIRVLQSSQSANFSYVSGISIAELAPATASARTASTATSRHIHDGHSLTDTYANSEVLPTLHQVITGAAPVYQVTHTKSTIPGSATSFRWPYYTGPATPFVNPRWDAGTFDTLMQAERGLTESSVAMPYTDPGVFLEDLRFELLFITNAVQNARSTPPDYILWGIWPGMDMIDWETIHDDEHYRHRLRADYLTWKIKQLHPTLPADWRVWLFPGFELTRRLDADMLISAYPGPEATYAHFFEDAIHPAAKLEVGMSVLVATMLYQVDLRTLGPSVYAFSGTLSNAEMDYFMARAWEIASAYEPCGMGGTQGAEPAWQLAINGDYHPEITTTAELVAATGGGQINAVWNGRDGAVPADAVSVISAAGVVGTAFTPALPAATGRYIEIPASQYHTITGLSFPNGVWQAALVEFVGVPNTRRVWAGSVNSANDYAGPYSSPGAGLSAWTAEQNGNWACNLSVGVYMPGEDNVASTKNPLLSPLRYEDTTKSNVPVGWWMDPSSRGVRHPDGEIVEVATNGAYPTTGSNALQRFRLGLDLEESNPPPGSTVRIWGWVVMDRQPTEQEWGDMFDWLSAKALKPA